MKEHIKPLIGHTPSAKSKLLSVWSHLSVETKIEILHYFNERECLDRDIAIQALDDECEYVRYLAAKGIVLFDESPRDKEIINKIANDKSDLVKYAQEEQEMGFEHLEPADFFKYPKNKQLAILRKKYAPYGATFADLVSWAIENKSVDEHHLVDLSLEYFNNPTFNERHKPISDYNLMDSTNRHLEALWSLTIKLPWQIANFWIEKIPVKGWNDLETIPEAILKKLDKRLLNDLFYRNDVDLKEFRKEVIFSNTYDNDLKSAALSNYPLTNEEFGRLLRDNPADYDGLVNSNKIRSVYLAALLDYNEAYGEDKWCTKWEDIMMRKEARVNHLSEEARRREDRECSIYQLAKELMPWKQNKANQKRIQELTNVFKKKIPINTLIAEGSTWETYTNLQNSIDGRREFRKIINEEWLSEEERYPE